MGTEKPNGEALVRELANRLLESSDERAAEVLARLVEQMRVQTVASLMERLPPTYLLDYARHPIELLGSSSEIGLRLISVEKEPFTVQWIEESLRRGDVFYDIGANVGAYSLIAAKTTANGARIFAFEPSASSFHDLCRNVSLNGCNVSVVPLPLALAANNGPLYVTAKTTAPGARQHVISRSDPGQPGNAAVLGVRLDDLVEGFGLPAPTHAKIDTDGYELDVLIGAERTLARPEWRSIIIELDPSPTNRNGKITTLLEDAGFGSGRRHERLPTPHFPHPEGRPDVYWTFTRAPTRSRVPRRTRPGWSSPSRSTPLQKAQRRAAAAMLALISFLFLLLVLLPEELGDRPYDVLGLKF